MSKYDIVNTIKDINIKDIQFVSNKNRQKQIDEICFYLYQTIKKYEKKMYDKINPKFINECYEKIKKMASIGKKFIRIELISCNYDEYFFTTINRETRSIFSKLSKNFSDDVLSDAFNMMLKNYENLMHTNIYVKCSSIHGDGDLPTSYIKYEMEINKEINNSSNNLCLGRFLLENKNFNLLLKEYFSKFDYKLNYYNNDSKLFIDINW